MKKSTHVSLIAIAVLGIIATAANAAWREDLAVGKLTVETDLIAPDGSIGADEIATSAVTSNKIAAGAVTAEKVAAGAAIPLSKLAPVSIYDTNSTTTITLYTPSGEGQLAFGKTGGTQTIWRCNGTLTTNGWAEVFRN